MTTLAAALAAWLICGGEAVARQGDHLVHVDSFSLSSGGGQTLLDGIVLDQINNPASVGLGNTEYQDAAAATIPPINGTGADAWVQVYAAGNLGRGQLAARASANEGVSRSDDIAAAVEHPFASGFQTLTVRVTDPGCGGDGRQTALRGAFSLLTATKSGPDLSQIAEVRIAPADDLQNPRVHVIIEGNSVPGFYDTPLGTHVIRNLSSRSYTATFDTPAFVGQEFVMAVSGDVYGDGLLSWVVGVSDGGEAVADISAQGACTRFTTLPPGTPVPPTGGPFPVPPMPPTNPPPTNPPPTNPPPTNPPPTNPPPTNPPPTPPNPTPPPRRPTPTWPTPWLPPGYPVPPPPVGPPPACPDCPPDGGNPGGGPLAPIPEPIPIGL